MNGIIKDCSDPRLPEVIERSWYEFFKVWGSTPYGEVYEDKHIKRVNLNVPQLHHGVFLARLTPENMAENIDENIAYFRERRLPFTWRTGPTMRPSDLGQHLLSHGLTYSFNSPGMAVELDEMNEDLQMPENLTIKLVDDKDSLRDYLEVCCPTFNVGEFIDHWFDMETSIGFDKSLPRRNYVGYVNGKPVANSHMLLTCGVAGIFCVATLPEARRKGIGTYLTIAPLREARDMGYNVGVLQSSRMGLGVYQRIGFQEYCTIKGYRWQPETPS